MKKWFYVFVGVISSWIAVFFGITTFLAVKKYAIMVKQYGDLHIVGIFSCIFLCGIAFYVTVNYFIKFLKTSRKSG